MVERTGGQAFTTLWTASGLWPLERATVTLRRPFVSRRIEESGSVSFYQVGSRFDIVCGATLIDLDGVSLEYLDSMGNVLASTSFGRRG